MSSAIATIQPHTPAQSAKDAKPLRISPRIRGCLMDMVWEGLTDNKAAVKAGITVVAIRLALKQPHIRAFYREQLHVLRESESAQNIHALRQVRNQRNNQMARVAAVKALEQLNDAEQSSRGSQALPGLQIVIMTGAPLTQPATIDANMKVISE